MYRHAVIDNGGGRATVVVTGDAVFTDIPELQRVLEDALDACEHLSVEVEGADAVDATLRVLLCSLHRRSELLKKPISARIPPAGGRRRPKRRQRVEGCPFGEEGDCCPLWDGRTGT